MAKLEKKPIILIPRTENNKNRQKSYQTKQWKNLRSLYLYEHPLCEICEQNGKVTPTEDIHHKKSPFERGISEEEKQYRLLDWNNLMALCKECHSHIHNQQQQTIITKRKINYTKIK